MVHRSGKVKRNYDKKYHILRHVVATHNDILEGAFTTRVIYSLSILSPDNGIEEANVVGCRFAEP